jgi:hypothetical protein
LCVILYDLANARYSCNCLCLDLSPRRRPRPVRRAANACGARCATPTWTPTSPSGVRFGGLWAAGPGPVSCACGSVPRPRCVQLRTDRNVHIRSAVERGVWMETGPHSHVPRSSVVNPLSTTTVSSGSGVPTRPGTPALSALPRLRESRLQLYVQLTVYSCIYRVRDPTRRAAPRQIACRHVPRGRGPAALYPPVCLLDALHILT